MDLYNYLTILLLYTVHHNTIQYNFSPYKMMKKLVDGRLYMGNVYKFWRNTLKGGFYETFTIPHINIKLFYYGWFSAHNFWLFLNLYICLKNSVILTDRLFKSTAPF